MYRFAILLLVLLGGMSVGHADGIHCSHALTLVEKEICQSAPLLALDGELNKWYPRARNSQINLYRFDELHRQWLDQRNACDREACIIASYKDYITRLKAYPLFYPVEDVTELKGDRIAGIDVPLSVKYGDGLKSQSGTQFMSRESRWDVKPFFDHAAYLRLIGLLEQRFPFFRHRIALTGIVTAINTKQQLYLYLTFSDYYADARPLSFIIVQLAEDGAISIVATASDGGQGKECAPMPDAMLTDFVADQDGLTFTSRNHCVAKRQRWSISKAQLSTVANLRRAGIADGSSREVLWQGDCGDLSCYGHRKGSGKSFLAFHNRQTNSPSRQGEQQAAFGGADETIYPDDMFWQTGSGETVEVIRSHDRDAAAWFLDPGRTNCGRSNCYFVNSFGDYGLWSADLINKKLTRLLPIQYIERFYPISIKGSNYMFFETEMSRFEVYLAREK
ncbi:lysozyme inhibitor LprI family protein [Brucella pituitosa]|uniref:lysozyme inhibitor LprI family protein n=1 Tax=Brucella pituitosa TaxID=571256 RepID=UPI0012601AE8|nr:hypothetical protein [Brucella pituitosa]